MSDYSLKDGIIVENATGNFLREIDVGSEADLGADETAITNAQADATQAISDAADAQATADAAVVAPVSPTAFTQTYSTVDATVPTATASSVATTAATSTTPFGYSEAQANAIVTALNAVIADSLQNRKLIGKLIDVLQSVGIAA